MFSVRAVMAAIFSRLEPPMRENNSAPRCKACGQEMYMTRFQSEVSPQRIKREQLYECLWCGEGEIMHFEERVKGQEAVAA
jgi:hypothetical protein